MSQTAPSSKHAPPLTESYSLPSEFLTRSDELRLDAAKYNPQLINAMRALRESGMRLVRLADITEKVFMLKRFKRDYVGPEHGLPYIQGSHIPCFQIMGLKYLSRAYKHIDQLMIKAGWLLISCSGTVGRVTMCPAEWDGWVATHDMVRIIPDEEKCPGGYLYAFLASPMGQSQLVSQVYGAVVDHLTEEHIGNVLVPLPDTPEDEDLVRLVNAAMKESVARRSEAVSLVNKAIEGTPKLSQDAPHVNWFSLRTDRMSEDLRMDAGSYNPAFLHALDQLSGMDTAPLREVAEVFMPTRFKRIYVDPEHGIPFLQGIHVTHFQAANLKYLFREHKHIDEVTVKAGSLLITRSGTVGRVTMCPSEWDGWAATEDIIRVIPKEKKCPGGYLYSFLASPMGQIQLTSQVYGAVVDHLTEEHVKNVLVPLPTARTAKKIDSIVREGIGAKSQAVALAEEGVKKLIDRFEKH
ncbi:MAG: restriction endonuclease subunit S [Pirellulales bacterium]|nr:restriction endonuclease subunit S [Pirellulales bacterium]